MSQDNEESRDVLRAALLATRAKALKPPPRMTLPEWADTFRYLAKEAGSTGGRWRTSRVEVARGPMLAVTEPGVRVITVMSSTQLMKTALLENIVGYFAHLDPCPMLLIQPKDEAVEAFSKEKLAPMLRSTPVLRDLIGTTRTRTSADTLTFKTFPGGFLAMVAAGSPTNLAMRSIRVTLADEIDKYIPTKEGDALTLAEERTATFPTNRLSVRVCSPTDETSRIAAAYEDSDMRKPFVSCPHCGRRQVLEFFRHVQWSTDVNGIHYPETARIHCEFCGCAWEEPERLSALQGIIWRQTKPFHCCGSRHDVMAEHRAGADDADLWRWDESRRLGLAKCPKCGETPVGTTHAGFHASKLLSPWADMPTLAKKWLSSKDHPEQRTAFLNTQLAQPARMVTERELRGDTLLARREIWTGQVPYGVAVLTVGVDTQDKNLEFEVVGWGRGQESWSLGYFVIEEDPGQPEAWRKLDEFLNGVFLREDGTEFKIAATCIDSGGNHTQQVYAFAKARLGRKIYAIKGASEAGGSRQPVWPTAKPLARRKDTFRPVIIGTHAAKDVVRVRLGVTEPGPGYCHFPADRDVVWFEQLTGERLVVRMKGGKAYRAWEALPGRRVEALDCRVYAYAALCALEHAGLNLDRKSEKIAGERRPMVLASESPVAAPMLSGAVAKLPALPTPTKAARDSSAKPRVFARFAI